jgi:hypothetical protein
VSAVVEKNPRTAFGELRVAEATPVLQIDAVSGLRTKTDVETFTDGVTGTATVENTGTGFEFKCTTGTAVGGYGLIRSKRYARYRPGQGTALRFTARFPDAGVALSSIRAGGVTSGSELSFGYDGVNFGILHRSGGVLEVRTLTFSAGAGGAETLTVTLDGTETEVTLSSGNEAHVAFETASDTFTGWNAYQNGDTVVFVATALGPKSGSFTVSSTGTADGTFATTITGVAATDNWVYQNQWNVDRMDGNGPSLMTLDHTKGNVYEVSYQYLGYGQISFAIEDTGTGYPHPVHRIEYANNNTSPSLLLPNLKVGWFAASLGSTTDLSIFGASCAAFIEGKGITNFRAPEAQGNNKTGIGTTLTSVIAIRNRAIINSNINSAQVVLKFVSVAVDGTKPARAEIILNPVLAGEPNWTYQDESNSIIEYDTAGTTVTMGANSLSIAEFDLGRQGNDRLDLTALDVILERTETLCIAVVATSGTTDAAASITWAEE